MKKIYLTYLALSAFLALALTTPPAFAISEVTLDAPEADTPFIKPSIEPLVEPRKETQKGMPGPDFSRTLSKDEVYSPSNKIESKKYSTVPVEVITSQDIENQNSPVISELLNTMTSVTVQRTGSMGDISSFRIRGTDRVRVTVDGIRADNPSDNKFYLHNYLSDDIERIEVVRGPQGNMSGAQASGGLVGIFTKQGYGEGKLGINSEFGSFGLFKENVSYGMGDEKKDFYLSTTFLRTNGGGAIDDPMGSRQNLTHDSYKNFNLVGNAGYRVMEGKGEVRQIFRFITAKKDIGVNEPWSASGLWSQDYNDYSTNLDISSTSIFNHKPNDWYDSSTRFGIFHTRYNLYTKEDEMPENWLEAYDDHDIHAFYRGTRLNFISQHNFSYKDWNTLSVGYNMEYNGYYGESQEAETMWSDATRDRYRGDSVQNDVYLSDTINIKDKLILKGGARAINHSIFGTYFTPNGSAALILPTFKIANSYSKFRGSWGQSISTPTFYQMFGQIAAWDTLVPNPGLRPEKLDGWDLGFEQSFYNDKLSFEVGHFNNKYRDYIDYTYDFITGGKYVNIDEARISGYEAGVKWQPNHIFKISANYTYSDSEDEKTGKELPAVPKNRVNVSMFITPNERFTFFARADATSDRTYNTNGDRVNGFVDVSMGSKIKLFSYKKMHVYLTSTVYNLLNQNMMMYKGYYQPGVHFRAGVFAEFRGLGGETL